MLKFIPKSRFNFLKEILLGFFAFMFSVMITYLSIILAVIGLFTLFFVLKYVWIVIS